MAGGRDGRSSAPTSIPKLAHWCDANLPFVTAVPNDPMPPLPFEAESFDFLYSISIFTHFPEDRQLPWIDEVKRVVKPGGIAMITVAGEAYADELSEQERRAYDAGRLVVRFGEQPGSNLCAVYHPPAYVQETLLGDLELLEYVPGDPEVQDAPGHLPPPPPGLTVRPAKSARVPGQAEKGTATTTRASPASI